MVSEYPVRRIVVTGSRLWTDGVLIHDHLNYYLAEYQQFLLGVGDCPSGADRIAAAWGRRNLMFPIVTFHAPWDKQGKYAGMLRNHFMIDMFRPQLVLAYLHPTSKGTKDCKEYAESKGIAVRPFYQGEGDANSEVQKGRT